VSRLRRIVGLPGLPGHCANDAIPRIAFGFAGGIGITGAVCGAVAGAVMAIGLKLGRADAMEEMLRRLAVSREFHRRFEAAKGDHQLQ
jgi:C_GCAxxG_C_C family probable redox protein